MGLYRFLASARELKEFSNDEKIMKINVIDDLSQISSYTDKKNCAEFNWKYSEENAQVLISCIKEHLKICPRIELWNTNIDTKKDAIIKKCSKNILTIDKIKDIWGKDSFEQPECLVVYNS